MIYRISDFKYKDVINKMCIRDRIDAWPSAHAFFSDEPVPDSACFLCNSGMFTGKKRHTTPETEGGIANVADTKRAGLDHGGKDF